jgi:O-antigen ligase
MRPEQGTVLTTTPFQGVGERALVRPEYEGVFGLVLLALLLVSTLDEALAPLPRGLVLVCFALLTVVNAGAAVGVYLGTVAVFSVHHFAGQGSWVQRPDNYMFLLLVAYLATARSFGHSPGRFGRTAVYIVLLLLTAFVHLIALLGVAQMRAMMNQFLVSWFVRSFVMPLAMFVVLRRAALSPREVRSLLLLVSAFAVYHGVVSLLEVAGWRGVLVPPWLADPEFNTALGSPRAGGLPMQAEWNSIDISLAMCVLLLRLDLIRSPIRVAWLVGAVLCIVAVYFTYTRAAWLGLLVGGVPLFWQWSGAQRITVRRRALFLAVVLGFAALILFMPSDVLRRRAGDASTIYFRLSIWIAGLEMIAQHPLFGVGFGQFAEHVGAYLRDLVWIPSSDAAQGSALAHNTFLSVGAEFGLVGLTLYLLALLGIYRAARAAAVTAWGHRGRSWVAGYTLVYLVNLQFITAHKLTSNLLFFGVMGAIAGMRGSWGRWPQPAALPARP